MKHIETSEQQRAIRDAFLRCMAAESTQLRDEQLAQIDREAPAVAAEVRALLASAEAGGVADHVFELVSAPELAITDDSHRQPSPQPDMQLAPLVERAGTVIGPYKLLEQIGEGGMGAVFMAQQVQPIKRKVALKVIKPGMDTGQAVARFEAERQALALMDHPNIARVLDAGTTGHGRPYFVMELVRGVPITEYCADQKLSTDARLKLFIDVCHGVQHAHQKGIIHRDLKPNNVLITLHDGKPVAKIIDFGIAKAMNQDLTDRTLFTNFAQMIGTPLYMSPEQAAISGLDVDTRSDVYSLGVLLYELLTGTTPFDRETLKKVGIDEIRRMIRETEPPRPSQRLSTLKARSDSTTRGIQFRDLKRSQLELRGELDWIVMKSLEKERDRRYQTAIALGADIQRYLTDEPVQACPPSFAYRLIKFARRHRAAFLVASAFVTILVVATIASSSLAAWAIQQKAIADFHKIDAQQEREVALDARALAEQQEQLAKQQMLIAKQQRDAAEYDAYVAGIQLVQRDLISGRARSELFDKLVPGQDRPDFRGWEWQYLHSRLNCQKFTLPFQKTNSALAWSPDGKHLATVDLVGRVNIWDMSNGQMLSALNGCPGDIKSMSWSADNKSLAAGSDRNVVAIWDLHSGSMRLLKGHAAGVNFVDWNTDSVRLASGGNDGNIYIWDSKTGDRLKTFPSNRGPVLSLDWHPDGIRLLTVSGWTSKELKIWSSETGTELFASGSGISGPAEFSPDGEHLAYGNIIMDLESGQTVTQLKGRPATGSPDGKQMATRCTDGTIRIWDAEKGTQLESIPGQSAVNNIAWSPTGRLFASAEDGVVKVWDADRLGAEVTHAIPDRKALSVAFSPDGGRVLASAQYGLVRMWDAESRKELFNIQSGMTWMGSVDWSPDSKRFVVSAESEVRIGDATSGEQLLKMEAEGSSISLAWNPSGKILAVGYRIRQAAIHKGKVRLFSISNARETAATTEVMGAVVDICWSPDGSRLAASCHDSSIRIWDTALNEVHQIVSDGARCLSWSPDGQYLAIGDSLNRKSTLAIYETSEWKLLRSFSLNSGVVTAIAWHPHLRGIASAHHDGTVRIWDHLTGCELCSFEAHKGISVDVNWSRDGMRLASCGEDGNVHIWDASPANEYLRRHAALRDQAVSCALNQNWLDAIEALDRLRQLHPEERELDGWIQKMRWLMAMKLAVDGQLADASAIFEQLDNEQANLPDDRLRLPGELFAAEQYEPAFALAESLVAEFPDQREYHDELLFLYNSRVTQLCRAGQFAEAEAFLRKLAEFSGDRVDTRAELVFEMVRTGNVTETIAMLERLAQAFASWPDYRPNLARRYSAVGEHSLAASIYEQLAEDHPDDSEYPMLRKTELAFILIADARTDEVIELLGRMETSAPQHPGREPLGNAYLQRATNFFENDLFDKASANQALADIERALELAPNNAVGYNRLAWLLVTSPDRSRWYPNHALRLATKATELVANDRNINTLGVVQYRAEDLPAAVRSLTKSWGFGSGSAPYDAIFLAMAHWQLGNEDEARRWYDEAVKRMPNASSDKELVRFKAEAEALLNVAQDVPKP